MSKVQNVNTALEHKLAGMDFYSGLADKDRMLSKLVQSMESDEVCTKPAERRRILRPAWAAAVLAALLMVTGFTALASTESFGVLLARLGFTGGNAHQVEHLNGYGDDAFLVSSVDGSEEAYLDEDWNFTHRFASFAEANAALRFTVVEPVNLSDNWVLDAISGASNGEDVHSAWIELVYDDPSTNVKKVYYGEDAPRHTKVWVYQRYIGEGAALNVNTTEHIENVTINGIEAVLVGPPEYQWRNGYSLIWVQNGIQMNICPMQCTYEELIAFAEAFIAPAND